MAKKRRTSAKHPFGLRRTSGLLRHTNEQTFSADASVEVGETIANPAFGRGGAHTGMEVARILFMPDPAAGTFGASAADSYFICQLQIGEAASTPVYIAPNDESLFAHLHAMNSVVTSGGGYGPIFPMVVPIINVVPVIIEQYFHVLVQGINTAGMNSKKVYTIIDYYTVDVPDSVYTQIALSRRDQS